MEYITGHASWKRALFRAWRGLRPRRLAERRGGWGLAVPAVLVLAGLLFTMSANTARGTDLRNDRRPELTGLISQRKRQVAVADARAAQLRGEIERQTGDQAGSDTRIVDQRERADNERAGAGMTAVHGPGVVVRLNDAPRLPDGSRPAGARPDDLLVHQQDLVSVMNALWSGGAEAMTVMDERIISTSLPRCAGNTLLLNGKLFSPPFVIKAVGNPRDLQRALEASEGVRLFRQASADFGLGYDVKVEDDMELPAYAGSTSLGHARVIR